MKELLHLQCRFAGLLALCLLAAAPVLAQSTVGSVNGTITDASGAAIPGASVTLSNIGTGIEVTSESNVTGLFVFVNVQPGNYTLLIEQTGFKTAALPIFNVGVNQTVTQNMSLEVGAVTETIEVMAQAELLQQSTSELGTVIGVKAVEDLPLNGRNFTQLLTLTPGATPVSTAQSNGIGSHDLANVGVPGASFSNPSIHGQWNRMNIHLLDGLNNTNYIGNMYVIPPIIDAIEEFKVQSHNDKAEFGGRPRRHHQRHFQDWHERISRQSLGVRPQRRAERAGSVCRRVQREAGRVPAEPVRRGSRRADREEPHVLPLRIRGLALRQPQVQPILCADRFAAQWGFFRLADGPRHLRPANDAT